MAEYKHKRFLNQVSDDIYDRRSLAGEDAPANGIYRCVVCGREVCVLQGNTLPPQSHHIHQVGFVQVQWQLVAAADPNIK